MSEEEAAAVWAEAARLQAERQGGMSEAELLAVGSEVNLPAEVIQEAIAVVAANKRQQALRAQTRLEQRRLLLGVAGVALALAAGWIGLAQQALLSAALRVDGAWAQVENQLQRRADLLPSLLALARERGRGDPALARALRDASESATAAVTPPQKIASSQQVEAAVAAFASTLSPWREGSTPRPEELEALQYEIVGTANRLAVERMRFNQAVEAYNRRLVAFPDGWIARAMGLKPRAFFRSQAVAGQGPSTGPQAHPR